MKLPLLVGLAVLAAVGPAGAVPRPLPFPQEGRESLEDFLERARARRDELHARLEVEVAAALAEFDKLTRLSSKRRIDAAVERVVELGPEATPLLAPRIEPGASPETRDTFLATQIVVALEQMDVSAVLGDLLRLLEQGSARGRANAARVLSSADDVDRVRPAVLRTFEGTDESELKAVCLRTLIALGGEQNDALLSRVLRSSDDTLVGLALKALADIGNAGVAGEVRGLLADGKRAETHALALLAYFRALPDEASSAEIEAFLRIAKSNAPADVRVAVIEALPDLGPSLSDLKRGMDMILVSRDDDVREAGLVALARLGDRNSRKAFLEPFEAMVDKNESWPEAYATRAAAHYRIGDYDDAIKDYREAIHLGQDDPKLRPETFVGLARSYARKGKLKDAADWLRKAPISLSQLHELADDPDFRELRESRWGAEAFGVED